MNARTLIITAGAVVALAAPAVANAKIAPAKVPAKHAAKKHAAKKQVAKPVFKRHGQPVYIYIPAPAGPISVESQQQWEQEYNDDLIAHGLDPVQFADRVSTTPTDSSDSTPTAAPDTTASDTTASDTPASDTSNATFTIVAPAAPSTSGTVDPSTSDDDC